MPYINLNTDCHVAIVSIVHCWEVAKKDIAGQDGKSGGGVLLTGLGLKSGGGTAGALVRLRLVSFIWLMNLM